MDETLLDQLQGAYSEALQAMSAIKTFGQQEDWQTVIENAGNLKECAEKITLTAIKMRDAVYGFAVREGAPDLIEPEIDTCAICRQKIADGETCYSNGDIVICQTCASGLGDEEFLKFTEGKK